MLQIDEILNKFEPSIIRRLDKDNIVKIINYLTAKKINYIEDIIDRYLDLFTMSSNEFIDRFEVLDKKYNYNLINMLEEDLSILEEMM